MAEWRPAFRSPLPAAAAAAGSGLQLTDETAHTKYRVVATAAGAATDHDFCPLGHAVTTAAGLTFCITPGEWTVHAAAGTAVAAAGRNARVIDITHVRAAVRLTGDDAAKLLAKVCALDLSDLMFPNAAAARTLVAAVATEVLRDDVAGQRSYLLLASRSFGRYLYDALMDAGLEYSISHIAHVSDVASSPTP
jgi:heterotetrameric sarcosine oxidase gamma subunit